MDNWTVQQMIDYLTTVEDKTLPFGVQVWASDGSGNVCYKSVDIYKNIEFDDTPVSVDIEVQL